MPVIEARRGIGERLESVQIFTVETPPASTSSSFKHTCALSTSPGSPHVCYRRRRPPISLFSRRYRAFIIYKEYLSACSVLNNLEAYSRCRGTHVSRSAFQPKADRARHRICRRIWRLGLEARELRYEARHHRQSRRAAEATRRIETRRHREMLQRLPFVSPRHRAPLIAPASSPSHRIIIRLMRNIACRRRQHRCHYDARRILHNKRHHRIASRRREISPQAPQASALWATY